MDAKIRAELDEIREMLAEAARLFLRKLGTI